MKTFLNFKNTTLATLGLVALSATYNAMAFDTDEIKDGQTAYTTEFNSLDKDQDGTINWSETKSDKTITHKVFKAADTDNDGTLTKEEYADAKTQVDQKKVSRVASDSWITTKAKAELLREEELKSFKISVETHKGEVLLSGFVDSEATKDKAEQVVSAVKGVKSVKNSLVVKS